MFERKVRKAMQSKIIKLSLKIPKKETSIKTPKRAVFKMYGGVFIAMLILPLRIKKSRLQNIRRGRLNNWEILPLGRF